ncbi:MAG TPA: nicotinamide-nucleotide adenylyltransferase, partial [Candidatus Thermoplasmatota archaeon]|nr:nicotinamide-nucleotide adenylyltransferase [Candidatus Thermoplasmatota archaeon]
LFLGRFQPFHLGHLDVVRRLAREHGQVIVGIGSANVSHTALNPFTGGERLEMVLEACREAGIGNVVPVCIPDVGRNAVWAAHVLSLVPSFSTLHTNNPLPARLFAEAGRKVAPAPFHDRARYEGTRVRRLMLEDGSWRDLVPPAVARVVDACRGVERMRILAREDGKVEGRDASV